MLPELLRHSRVMSDRGQIPDYLLSFSTLQSIQCIVSPILKKGNPLSSHNYKPIILVDFSFKVCTSFLFNHRPLWACVHKRFQNHLGNVLKAQIPAPSPRVSALINLRGTQESIPTISQV
jgi:hypothetical protein